MAKSGVFFLYTIRLVAYRNRVQKQSTETQSRFVFLVVFDEFLYDFDAMDKITAVVVAVAVVILLLVE